MIQLKTIAALRAYLQPIKAAGASIGFVPTMGFLHEGHMSLIQTARKQNDTVVASIFVNPLQFGPNEDFAAYPRSLQDDAEKLAAHGCDVLFAPEVEEMYPQKIATSVEVAEYSQFLCGQSRPNHFRGVATVVTKLFNIVSPTRAYFGQKDGQQGLIVSRLASDLSMAIEIVIVPTVRELDGLAKSSRNVYLGVQERAAAPILYGALSHARDEIAAGVRDASRLRQQMRDIIATEPLARLEYAEIVDVSTVAPVEKLSGSVMIALAVYVGRARLIDNIMVELPAQ